VRIRLTSIKGDNIWSEYMKTQHNHTFIQTLTHSAGHGPFPGEYWQRRHSVYHKLTTPKVVPSDSVRYDEILSDRWMPYVWAINHIHIVVL